MDIGHRMKELRIQYGLTQQELADRAELTKGFISQLERNSHCFFKLIPRFLSHHPRPPFLSVFHFVCIVLPLFQERKLYLKKIRIS